MKQLNESQIQQQIFLWYNNNFCLKKHKPQNVIFSVPNESKNAKEQMYKKAIGLMSGVSDLIVIRENEVLFIEVKTPKGKQSDKQKTFESKVSSLGFRYVVVRSLDEFISFIEK